MASVVVAALYLVAAAGAAAAVATGSPGMPTTAWLPLHLALAGGGRLRGVFDPYWTDTLRVILR